MQQWKRHTYILWLVVFLSGICWTMVMPFMPIFLRQLGVTNRVEFWTGLFAAIASACTMVMAPIWGAVGDRFGRRLMMLRAGIFLSLGYGLMAVIETPLQLLGIRMMIGILSGFVPMAVALVGVSTPREHVGFALGIVQTAWPSGALVGPLLGGFLLDWAGLRSAMVISAGALALCTALVYIVVKEQFSPPPRQHSSLLADLKVAASHPVLMAIILVTTVSMASISALDPILVPFVKVLIGPGSPSWLAGLLYAIPGLAFILAAPWWARRAEKVGFVNTVALGLLLSGLFYIPQALVTGPWQFGLLRVAVGLSGAAVGPGVAAMLAMGVPAELRGRGFGLNQSASAAGSVMGPLLGGIIGSFIGQKGVFLLTSGIMFGGYLWVKRVLVHRLQGAGAIAGQQTPAAGTPGVWIRR